jgi:hypothetical protein
MIYAGVCGDRRIPQDDRARDARARGGDRSNTMTLPQLRVPNFPGKAIRDRCREPAAEYEPTAAAASRRQISLKTYGFDITRISIDYDRQLHLSAAMCDLRHRNAVQESFLRSD